MSSESYFGKRKTSGSFVSAGFDYQDCCALYFLLDEIFNKNFLSIGVETDDDFCLLYKDRKINVQVKKEQLTLHLLRSLISETRIVVGSSAEKHVITFTAYLKHYRNHQNSSEPAEEKLKVADEFNILLKKYGLDNAPNSWGVEILPEERIEDSLRIKCVDWAGSRNEHIEHENCLNQLLRIVSQARKSRGYIGREEVEKVLLHHSMKIILDRKKSIFPTEEYESLDSIGISKDDLAVAVRDKALAASKLLKDGNYHQAYEIYTNLLTLIESEKILTRCAAICSMLGRVEEGEKYCQKALSINPASFEGLVIMGELSTEKRDHDEALEYFSAALLLDPENPYVLYNLGFNYLKLDEADAAVNYFRRSIDYAPLNSSAYLNISILLYSKGIYEEALEYVDRSLMLEPGMPEALSHKGEILRFFGNTKEAIRLFNRCLSKTPDNKLAKRGLALALLDGGDSLGAALLVEYYSEIILSTPAGKVIEIADLGWVKSIGISIEVIDKFYVSVNYNDLVAVVKVPSNDIIGIGSIHINTIDYPVIVKVYEHVEHYAYALENIKNVCSEEDITDISGYLMEMKNHSRIMLDIGGFKVYGETNPCGNEGLNVFVEKYEEHHFFILIIKHVSSQLEFAFNLSGIEMPI